MNTSRFMIAALLVASSFGMFEPQPAQAQMGMNPWMQPAYPGGVYPRRIRYRYSARYAPLPRRFGYGAPMYGGANYGGYPGVGLYGAPVSPILPSAFPRPTSLTSSYGPSYYGGGFVSSGSGCSPCGVPACSPCNSGCSTGNCPSGNCATTNNGAGYSPEPVADTIHETQEVTPTFKPAPAEKPPVPDPSDDFVGVNRRENDNENKSEFISPRLDASPAAGSTIPMETPTTIPPGNSVTPATTIPGGGSVLPNSGGAGAAPMSPIPRPMSPAGGTTIPDPKTRSTIPSGDGAAPPTTKPFPRTYDLNKPAPSEPTSEEAVPSLLPETSAKPLRVEPLEVGSAPVAQLVIQRKRVVMQASYRIPVLSRIDVPAQKILEAGSTKLVIR